jgi:hypothetical protein
MATQPDIAPPEWITPPAPTEFPGAQPDQVPQTEPPEIAPPETEPLPIEPPEIAASKLGAS